MLLITCVACIPQNSEILQTVAASLGSYGNNTIHQLPDLPIHPARLCRTHLLLVLLCDNDNEEQLKLAAYIVTVTSPNFVLPTLHWPHLYLIWQDYHKEGRGFLKMLTIALNSGSAVALSTLPQAKKMHLTCPWVLSKNRSIIAACCVTVISVVSSVWRLKYLVSLTAAEMFFQQSWEITFNTAVALVRLHVFSNRRIRKHWLEEFGTMISQLKVKMVLSKEICEEYFCMDYRLPSYRAKVGL